MKLLAVLTTMLFSSLAAFTQNSQPRPSILQAPTYYIVVHGHLKDEDTIAVRGASNLPPGSMILIQVGDGTKPLAERTCVGVGKEGLFLRELHPVAGIKFKFSTGLGIDAIFRTSECEQPDGVLQVVGKHGQYLGNDNYDNRIDIHMQWTPGMIDNPQLFQESGWYFGLRTSAPVSQ
jgi:hypothetical protein